MIAALFVQRRGVYFDLDGVDPWDASRDARLYAGASSVVAHPPCARWCRLAGLVEAADSTGKTVWTQRDWLMAIRWTEALAADNPERRFLNATEGWMGFLFPCELKEMEWREIPQLKKRVGDAIGALPARHVSRWDEWRRSLERCKIDLDGEIAFEKLLSPLWPIWRPVFERELDLDPRKISFEEKMRLNERLFYDQVIQEHLDVLDSI